MWNDYVFGWMIHSRKLLFSQSKWYVLILFKYLIPLTCLNSSPVFLSAQFTITRSIQSCYSHHSKYTILAGSIQSWLKVYDPRNHDRINYYNCQRSLISAIWWLLNLCDRVLLDEWSYTFSFWIVYFTHDRIRKILYWVEKGRQK